MASPHGDCNSDYGRRDMCSTRAPIAVQENMMDQIVVSVAGGLIESGGGGAATKIEVVGWARQWWALAHVGR